VEKIVMFNKGAAPNTLHILSQFAHVESAKQALTTLQGQNVYANACKLQIQFSKHEDLNVTRNGERTRDFLNPHLPSDTALLPTPPVSSPQGTSVLLVTNLNSDKTTCATLFSLFSLYGGVDRIKIFFNKPDQALIQMSDQTGAQNAFSYLKGAVVFGKAMGVTHSKHRAINASTSEDQAENLLADYDSRSQRFRDGAASKSLTGPTSLLHCSNLSHDTTAQDLTDHCTPYAHVLATKVFEVNERFMGFVQFDSVEGATDALCVLHQQPLKTRSIRLAFSRKSLLKK